MVLAVVAVLVLVVWLVSAQVRLSAAYATQIGVLVALILASRSRFRSGSCGIPRQLRCPRYGLGRSGRPPS